MNQMTRIEPAAVEVPARITVDEFMEMIGADVFDGWKVELVKGEIVRMSPAMSRHMTLQREILYDLLEIFGRRGDWVVQPELTVLLGTDTLRDIDVGVSRRFPADDNFVDPASVSLAVEVSTTTLAYDLGAKARDYAGAGIPHYWVVDVRKEAVHILTNPLDGDYTERRLVPFGEPLAVPGTDRTITIA